MEFRYAAEFAAGAASTLTNLFLAINVGQRGDVSIGSLSVAVD